MSTQEVHLGFVDLATMQQKLQKREDPKEWSPFGRNARSMSEANGHIIPPFLPEIEPFRRMSFEGTCLEPLTKRVTQKVKKVKEMAGACFGGQVRIMSPCDVLRVRRD
jgi:hypothetical protein